MKSLKKHSDNVDQINQFAERLGIEEKDKTVFRVSKNTDNAKILSLIHGHCNGPEPWFVIDENDNLHTMISLSTLKNILDNLRQNQKENFELRLEKAIYQQIPIDFNDVWLVAMDAIKEKFQDRGVNIDVDLDKIVAEVKKKHPNLFVDMQEMIDKARDNERL
ncbi:MULTISPECIES: DUF2603 domain-containing protein [unclassified Campylobacter]|uniref:DUF2603 domain-containing protein n=1 Tax=unclassified Campylobacter TaxID=2593542 RepID=UPI001237AA89|nr:MULTISPECIES: DUF2603 domain-containing protein [unclassified Campylobacter]KAA6226723.1 DUF2603 domain-containing protein [Campylobacter sp. LR196d]KAA6228681.1 DUF2603 domain-containing protein [Campylobacter sp. LR185c]KAA6229084.1 DUF2603 domain-containing protein [Campylobacter sp. LR286c]KAA6230160.1 DUF2603 domain-containing protein [Campylobacter sp. LR291e]KAA6233681.1 DUF2603 domain-containing protein [Campylobacter sp. LR264d]